MCADGIKLCLNGGLDAGVDGEVVGLVKVLDVGDLRWGDGGWGVWDEDGVAVVGPERAGEGDADEARGGGRRRGGEEVVGEALEKGDLATGVGEGAELRLSGWLRLGTDGGK